MSSNATDAVRSESIRAVYRQLPLTLGVSAGIALVTAVVLSRRVELATLGVWLAAFAVMVVLRAVACARFARAPERQTASAKWERISVAGSAAAGLLWGACSLLMMPPDGFYPLFISFVIGGLCAGSITVNAAHLPSVVAFILPAALPLAGCFAWHGGELAFAMAFLTVAFAGSLLLTAWRYAHEFAAAVRARLALAERTAELASANAKLRAEIAEREGAEAALRQAQKMEAVGSLTAGVAHDVNNVLMVVRGAAEVLRRRLGHTPGHLRQVAAILRATDRGAALTRRLLAFAREQTLSPDVLDLNATLEGIASLLAATLGKSVHLRLELDEAVPRALVDRSGFEHAIINLAINARDAMPEGGTLTLRTSLLRLAAPDPGTRLPPGSYVQVTVADTGTGMTEAVLARAFDPFFTTKPVGQGSGLGLSQVYGFLRQSGGALRLESAPAVGTTAFLYLPASEAVQATSSLPPEMSPRPAGLSEPPESRNIVLLDDEDLVREVVAELLEGAGYCVAAFARAADALRRIEVDPTVGLLMTDLGLPDCSGDEVARRARVIRPDLPVLFITGYNDPNQLASEPWQLHKPFAEADLLDMVAQVLAQHSAAA